MNLEIVLCMRPSAKDTETLSKRLYVLERKSGLEMMKAELPARLRRYSGCQILLICWTIGTLEAAALIEATDCFLGIMPFAAEIYY